MKHLYPQQLALLDRKLSFNKTLWLINSLAFAIRLQLIQTPKFFPVCLFSPFLEVGGKHKSKINTCLLLYCKSAQLCKQQHCLLWYAMLMMRQILPSESNGLKDKCFTLSLHLPTCEHLQWITDVTVSRSEQPVFLSFSTERDCIF